MPSINEGISDLNEILDRGFRACFEICEELPDVFRKHAKGPYEIDTKAVEALLTGVLNRLYERMAKTLFAALCRVVALRQGPDKINFYFWPGYSSLLLKHRIYFKADASPIAERFRDMGIGFCESHRDGTVDTETITPYHDCSQARWYHYIWKQPKEFPHPHPGSVYRWFRDQRPKVSPKNHDLIASLTVSTDSTHISPEALKDYDTGGSPQRFQFVLLDATERDPTIWAIKVADKINSALRKHVEAPDILFPDVPGPGKYLRSQSQDDVRLLELGLWMHSVFSDRLPENLKEIEARLMMAGQPVVDQFQKAVKDPMAAKIEERQRDCVRFTDWSTISLHPMLSPESLSSPNYEKSLRDNSIDRNTIGSAVFLSSTTLGKDFLGLVRSWVRTVYGMIRNSEMLVLSHNEMLQTSRRFAMIAGPWFAHEINAILGKNTMLKTQLENCSKEAISLRRMVFNTAESVALLAYIATSAVLETNPEQQKPVQARFREPLRELNGSGRLRETLLDAARMVYHDVRMHRDKMSENGTIPVLEGKVPEVAPDTSGVCFLLVNELVTNHVRHSRDKSPANFEVRVDKGKVTITLSAKAERLPVSKTLGYLDQMLSAFMMGEVRTEWLDESCSNYQTRITVQFENCIV